MTDYWSLSPIQADGWTKVVAARYCSDRRFITCLFVQPKSFKGT